MAKLTDKQIGERLKKIGFLKWEFLRRNEKYIQACETWSGRRRHQWKDGEIVLSYLCRIKIPPSLYQDAPRLTKELFGYYDEHYLEWGHLTSTPEEIKTLRSMGLNPPTTNKQHSWHNAFKEHDINLPLNPNCKYVPFFVRIAPEDYISEPHQLYNRQNDVYLEKGSKSYIEVNWAMPSTHLQHLFTGMVEQKKSFLSGILKGPISLKDLKKALNTAKGHGLVQGRSGLSFDDMDYYLKVWDAYQPCKGDFVKIAERVWKKEFEEDPDMDITAAKRKAERFHEKAKQLIEGGYKTLSRHLGVPP